MSGPTEGKLILASASPRRLELLRQIGVEPAAVAPADIDETPQPRELPAPYAARLAREKGAVVAPRFPGDVILSADTVVAVGRRILGKPSDIAEEKKFLSLLSGRRHRVIGGVAVIDGQGKLHARTVISTVRFRRLTADDIENYAEGGEWQGKAGGYAIQGRAAPFISFISGSYSNIVGLPLYETAALLASAGFHWQGS
jgi:septum formation protein